MNGDEDQRLNTLPKLGRKPVLSEFINWRFDPKKLLEAFKSLQTAKCVSPRLYPGGDRSESPMVKHAV
jgi:hypothetical protein